MRKFSNSGTRALWGALMVFAVLLPGCANFSNQLSTPEPTDRFPLPAEGNDIVGAVQIAIASDKDTLPEIARRYNLGYEEIVAANPGVNTWQPGEGTAVVLPTAFILPDGPREGVVLNLASMRMYYYPKNKDGQVTEVITHPIGIGREGWQTPQGETRITQKTANPKWTVPASVRKEHAANGDPLPAVVPPGPDNPLGAYAMRLSMPSYLIHGTNKPWGVGMRISHGCIRMYPEDIARIFGDIPVGTPVHIIDEPYLTGWRNGQLYLEAHTPLAEDTRYQGGNLQPLEAVLSARIAERPVTINLEQAENAARAEHGVPVPLSIGTADLSWVLAVAPRVPSTPPWVTENYDVEELKQLPTYSLQ